MIENLQEKLNGEMPVNRRELFELINSWGRKLSTNTFDGIDIYVCEPKECYNLSNLDISKIVIMDSLFRGSLFNGDLSKWDTSNCKNMDRIFSRSNFNNDSLKNWNTSNVNFMSFAFWDSLFNGDISNWNISNVKTMKEMFYNSKFDGDISSWEFNKNVECYDIFEDNKSFSIKYNNNNKIPKDSTLFIQWFEDNRGKIKELNLSKDEVLDFFSFDSNLQKEIN